MKFTAMESNIFYYLTFAQFGLNLLFIREIYVAYSRTVHYLEGKGRNGEALFFEEIALFVIITIMIQLKLQLVVLHLPQTWYYYYFQMISFAANATLIFVLNGSLDDVADATVTEFVDQDLNFIHETQDGRHIKVNSSEYRRQYKEA